MRLYFTAGPAVLALILLSAAPAAADNPAAPKSPELAKSGARELIIGKWQPADGKDKATLEFLKDGKLKIAAEEFSIDGTYKFVDDATLEAKINVGGKESTVKLKVTVSKDELTTQEEGKKTKETFKRLMK